MKIVFTDSDTVTAGDISFSPFAAYGTVVRYGVTAPGQTAERVRDADAIICNKTLITREIMERSPNLKYIGVLATGYNNVDIECAKEKGIIVTNIPGYSTDGVVQLVFALIFELFINLGRYSSSVNEGDWIKSPTFSYFPYPIRCVAGKTIGVVGYGTIGSRVAKAADAFGMRVIVNSRTQKPECPFPFVDMDTLLKESDIVTLHCPLTPQSEKLINAETLSEMKDGAVLINTSRGPVVDEQALRDALDSGKLAGAGLDVLCKEPMTEDCPLFGAPNCIITPHIAWAAYETRKRLIAIAEENLASFINGTPQNSVSG
ncbi:MAG: D-2-hydroxyacid dehydrogenase [Ruminiclostridium sp.]|nr:D-2-hydroxyacid dehydrogenase [Ruminiclostridium sp.]